MRFPALAALTALALLVLAAFVLIGPGPAKAVGGPAGSLVSTGTPVYNIYTAPTNLASRDNAGEPSIGVNWNTGAVLYQAYSNTYKVTWNSAAPPVATWSDVSSPILVNLDPILFTDSPDGRTYAAGLVGPCSNAYYSSNDGSSWSPSLNACSYAATDHQSIGAGPYHTPTPATALYSRIVYYCAQESYNVCSASTDGGRTFGGPAVVGGDCRSFHGHIKVSADGTAYLPNAFCGSRAGGGITTNNGGSWTSYHVTGSSTGGRGFDPSVATTPDNTLYEAWSGTNNHPYVASSTNHGATWSTPTDLASTVSPSLVAATFQAATAGDNGRVAIAFLGTTTGTGSPYSPGFHGVWDLYVSYTYNAGSTWATQKITPDPVQRGCLNDGGLGSSSCRNLLDFMDASVTLDGRVVIGYADGCISTCAGPTGTEAQSTHAYATIARQTSGKGLFAAYD